MNDDVSQNLVIFRVEGLAEPVLARAPTKADDAVEQAWASVREQHKVRASKVSAVYSEWEPSAGDLKFMAKNFKKADCKYSFARPGPDGWERAFAEARAVMAEAHAARQQQEQEEELLPVLWSASSPSAGLLDALPHRPLVPGRLSVAVAAVGRTPEGKVGMHHVTRHQQEQLGTPVEKLFDVAYGALTRGLKLGVRSSGDDVLVSVTRETLLAASAIALPDLYSQLSPHFGGGDLLVGLPCADQMVVVREDSSLAADVRQQVLNSPHDTTELVPSVLRLGPGGLALLAERSR
ncbi:hypothetical protein VSH64_33625 [Amycolatopsis rhabdoformis]|uniref:Uncharacterized protein n=1 Tax=Amycolatopsis rhabdoformis TaxID=1448059 RepID=A0ABZ1I053_9PSEU|nr:hypothetical protein [Amycolatopsis rhabdoformis]WSE27763.1 hypothetical protein VSH64_33625 [Amycolatopsis rhabdoformis]